MSLQWEIMAWQWQDLFLMISDQREEYDDKGIHWLNQWLKYYVDLFFMIYQPFPGYSKPQNMQEIFFFWNNDLAMQVLQIKP